MELDDITDRLRGTVVHRVWRALKPQYEALPPTPAQLKNQRYDEETLLVMQRVLKPDSVCIDGGCHVGTVLEQMCRLAPSAQHYAFEPLPHLFRRLLRKFPGQHLSPHALGEKSGTTTFTHIRNAPAFSGLRERNYEDLAVEKELITVNISPLDDCIPPDTTIAFIKLDLEGGEYHAIKGGANMIRRCKPVIVFEAGTGSTGCYGVTGEMLFALCNDELDYNLSTLSLWLSPAPRAFTLAEFLETYLREFFFIAYPKT